MPARQPHPLVSCSGRRWEAVGIMAFALVLAILALEPHSALRTDILGMLSLRQDLKAATPPVPPMRPAMTEPLPATEVVERVAQPAPMLAESPPPSPVARQSGCEHVLPHLRMLPG